MSTRDRMLDAAAQVMRERGLARTTTKEIARAAGYSEAALYKHFRDKLDLFLAVLAERTPANLAAVLTTLPDRVGKAEIRDTLALVATKAVEFYAETFPIAASIFSEPSLLAAQRAALHERGAGPHHAGQVVGRYLTAERDLGRLRADADPHAAAALLLGACFQRAFLSHFVAPEPAEYETTEAFVAALLDTLLAGLLPDQPGC